MAFENYTISQYRRAEYKKDYSVISKEELDIVNSEYIETAGLYDTEDFNMTLYIQYLNSRVNFIKMSISAQKKFLAEFGVPYLPGLEKFKKFGHTLKWTDETLFLNALEKIRLSETKFISQLEGKIREQEKYREKKSREKKKDFTPKENEQKFITTLISLRKLNYQIDNDKTSMEELALTIKKQLEETI